MDSPRERRLRSDFRAMTRLKDESTIVDFKAYGNPPERYLITLNGKGLKREDPGTNTPRASVLTFHQVEIYLGADYPRARPQLQWKTELFHPNISGTGLVCLGGYSTHWVPSLNLDELVEMLWDMVRFANYDVKSPYNLVAARWVAGQSEFKFPLDPRPVRDREPAPAAATPPPVAAAPPAPKGGTRKHASPAAKPAPVKAPTPPLTDARTVPARPAPPASAPATPAAPRKPAAPAGDIVFLDHAAPPPPAPPASLPAQPPPAGPKRGGTRKHKPKPPDEDVFIIE